VEIGFKNKQLQKVCENPDMARKEYGKENERKLTQRIMELRDADNLDVVSRIPAARLHPLKGDRKHEYSVDLAHPFRLVFIASPECIGDKTIEAIELVEITEVIVEEIVDYHGKHKKK
jgi:proteic killer suppression protein